MVKVTLELSKLEIQMLVNCIESAIDVGHSKNLDRIKKIKEQFENYL